jgi:hypothetical protein
MAAPDWALHAISAEEAEAHRSRPNPWSVAELARVRVAGSMVCSRTRQSSGRWERQAARTLASSAAGQIRCSDPLLYGVKTRGGRGYW